MNNIDEKIVYWIMFIKNRMKKMNLNAEEVFMGGNCGNLYYIFSKIFGEKAIPHRIYLGDIPMHIVTEIEGSLYDISGKTSIENYYKYLKEKNGNVRISIDELHEKTIKAEEVNKQCNRYKIDENFGESIINNEMNRLNTLIDEQLQLNDSNKKEKNI